ncbi:hypothetical protein QFZ20_001335 [Flavobacterium sp. W4I14]|nr:hypothetical protein [Flavobacterium sp. W4I14]
MEIEIEDYDIEIIMLEQYKHLILYWKVAIVLDVKRCLLSLIISLI